MERRSFLASLAALFVARRLPKPIATDGGLYKAELSLGSNEMLEDAIVRCTRPPLSRGPQFVSFVWDEGEQRYKARIPPGVREVNGLYDAGEVAFTITTTP